MLNIVEDVSAGFSVLSSKILLKEKLEAFGHSVFTNVQHTLEQPYKKIKWMSNQMLRQFARGFSRGTWTV